MTPVQVYAAAVAQDASAVFNGSIVSRDYYFRRLKISIDSFRRHLASL